MSDDVFLWQWEGRDLKLGMTRLGDGPTLLMLPAPSSISTRHELLPLQKLLSPDFATVSIDLPGFGNAPRPPLAWSPAALRSFLADVLAAVRPFATVAAGHSATYVLERAAAAPGAAGRLVLIAPTWRGPLPTVLGRRPAWLAALARTAEVPLLGPLLYRLNVNRWTLQMMGRGHVYADPGSLSGERLAEKLAVVEAPGARHASLRFVTGELDALASRDAFLALAGGLLEEALVIYGSATPRRSMAEIAALIGTGRVQAVEIEGGKLAVHEEFPAETAAAVRSFLAAPPQPLKEEEI